jgi:hypothetical protein
VTEREIKQYNKKRWSGQACSAARQKPAPAHHGYPHPNPPEIFASFSSRFFVRRVSWLVTWEEKHNLYSMRVGVLVCLRVYVGLCLCVYACVYVCVGMNVFLCVHVYVDL